MRLFEILRSGFGENRRRKWAENFAMFNAAVENVFHFGATRVRHDAAITQCPRAPFCPSLKPPKDFAIGDDGGRATSQFLFTKLRDDTALLCQATRINSVANFFLRVLRAPVGMVHDKRPRLAKNLVPHEERGSHGKSAIPRRGMNVDLLEWRRIKNLAVGHAIERHPSRQANGFQSCAVREFL